MYTAGSTLNAFSRGKTVLDEIVLHESVTRTRDECVRVLRTRGLGVHLTVDRDGSVLQHVPFDRACAHAEGFGAPSLHNERSIAVEVINPYYGAFRREGDFVIDAVWAHKGTYIMPTSVQLETTWQVVRELTRAQRIPLVFPGYASRFGVGPKRFTWGRIKKHEVPGVMAHHRWHHADALVPEFYCLLRHLGYSQASAWRSTVDTASSGQRVTPATAPEL